ncbi:unnamed protein product [Ilex paraguariensis]|uniref:RING-type domain-containing protein n=1 Tax=Ilex paraguariensis TaxID=185542 RepID=A0ABC8RS93_9AQUA
MKEVAQTGVPPSSINLFSSLQHQHPPQSLFSTALRLDLNCQPPPQKITTPFKSFTPLLTQVDAENDLSSNIQEQIIKYTYMFMQGDQLRYKIADLWRKNYTDLLCAAEERAAKKLKERELEMANTTRRNCELEEKVAQFRAEAQVWQAKAKNLEQTTSSLMAALQEAKLHGGSVEEGKRLSCAGCEGTQQEDAESSFVDPDRVELVRLACKACERRVATVMMWPCRHVCVCVRCDAVSKACPVCLLRKTTSVEVCLP